MTLLSRDPISLRRDVRAALEEAFREHLRPGMTVYDIGCGQKPFAQIMRELNVEYLGVDLPDGFYGSEHVDMVGTAYDVPAPDGQADAVILAEVIEHLERPHDAFMECHRLLKPGGLLFISSPFLYPIHAAPRDFIRVTPYYVEYTLADIGYTIQKTQTIGGFWYLSGFFFSMYLGSLNRGILQRAGIIRAIQWLVQAIALCLHRAEEVVFGLAAKDVRGLRSVWAGNSVYVASKNA